MDLATFEDHLDRYGGDLALWPIAFRADAFARVQASAEARSAVAAMRAVEEFMATTKPDAGAIASAAIAARATRQRQVAPTRRLVAGAGWGVAAAVVLVLGYSIGNVGSSVREDNPDRVMAMALDSPTSAIDVD